MRLLHLADLHIGKKVNEFSMIKDQEYVLEQILTLVCTEHVDGVLVAGDVFDRTVPSVEAVQLLDKFLTALSEQGVQVCLIGGNHDSAERLSFGARLMEKSGIHVAGEYRGCVEKVRMEDGWGPVDIYLLPFIKPAQVRAVWKEEAQEIVTYEEAVAFALGKVELDRGCRNLLVAHQFVAGAAVCDSEERSVGGLDQVSVSCFDDFDYVALGHLHGPQQIGRETVRYAGTPLKYSFSEMGHQKSAALLELRGKGDMEIRLCPLTPLHEMRQVRGSYEEVTRRDSYAHTDTKDYVRVVLTDEEDIFDAVGKLRAIYPNLMRLEYDNKRTGAYQTVQAAVQTEEKEPIALAEELFLLQNNREMGEEQRAYLEQLMGKVWEDTL